MQRKIRAIKIYGVQIKVRVVVSKIEHRKRIAGISDQEFFLSFFFYKQIKQCYRPLARLTKEKLEEEGISQLLKTTTDPKHIIYAKQHIIKPRLN